MNTRILYITLILFVLLSPSIEAQPVTIGFNENVALTIIDEYIRDRLSDES